MKQAKGKGTIWTRYLSQLRFGAAKRGYSFEIDVPYIQQLLEQQGGKCAISGLPIYMDRNECAPTASLDRKENHRGYVKGNVQWVHKVVNRMKSDYDEAYFIAMCNQVAAHRGGGKPLSPAQRQLLAGQPLRGADRLTKPVTLTEFSRRKPVETHDAGFGILL